MKQKWSEERRADKGETEKINICYKLERSWVRERKTTSEKEDLGRKKIQTATAWLNIAGETEKSKGSGRDQQEGSESFAKDSPGQPHAYRICL